MVPVSTMAGDQIMLSDRDIEKFNFDLTSSGPGSTSNKRATGAMSDAMSTEGSLDELKIELVRCRVLLTVPGHERHAMEPWTMPMDPKASRLVCLSRLTHFNRSQNFLPLSGIADI